MIREYQTGIGIDPSGETQWDSVISIDLSWVCSAMPCDGAADTCTVITMAGSGYGKIINAPYPEFMSDWLAARAGGGGT